jgi:hypothetical protein
MQRGTAGDDRAVLQHVGRAVQRGDDAAGFPDEHRAGRHVPWRQCQLPKTTEAAGRHVREIECRRAGPADAARRSHHRGELVLVAAQHREILEREPGADERVARLGEARHPERAVALPGAEPRCAPVREVTRDIVHDSQAQRAPHRACDRDRVLRVAVQIVRRAVERVHDPHDFARGRDVRRQLFAHDRTSGHVAREDLRDQRLRPPVGLGHEIVGAFLDPVRRGRRRGVPEKGGCAPRGASGHID